MMSDRSALVRSITGGFAAKPTDNTPTPNTQRASVTHSTRAHTVPGKPRSGREAACAVAGMTTRPDTRRESAEKSSQETMRGQRVEPNRQG